jgi:hypothetical protein
VVDVRVREDDAVQVAWIKGQYGIELPRGLAPSLEEPSIEKEALPPPLEEMT